MGRLEFRDGTVLVDDDDRGGDGGSRSSAADTSPPPPLPSKATRSATHPRRSDRDRDHERDRDATLTVFQAAPLAWRDDSGDLNPMEVPDFDLERRMLSDALRDAASAGGADVGLRFETATVDRLGAFLAGGSGSARSSPSRPPPSRALHFSCHGYPECLCFEDGSGGMQLLAVDDLRELVSAVGGGLPRFVFVSACYSRAAGTAFVRAGAPHVVCCRQDEPLMDGAAVEFGRNFYRALACGRTVGESFALAVRAVRLCPTVPGAAEEAGKFLLLPERGDHDVVIFRGGRKRSKSAPSRSLDPPPPPSPLSILPQPPQAFIGREVDVYKVIQAVLRSRLIQLTGPTGIGKGSTAAAACSYINERSRTFSFHHIIWLPLLHASEADDLSSTLQNLFDFLQQEREGSSISLDPDYRRICGDVIEKLHREKALVVIDTNDFLNETRRDNLSTFLRTLFRGTRDVKVMVVSRYESDFSLEHDCVESRVDLRPLDFHDAATLFGVLSPHVSEGRSSLASTPRQFVRFLVPEDQGCLGVGDAGLSGRSAEAFRLIGGGIPSDVRAAAKSMTPEKFDELMAVGSRRECRVQSRVELERSVAELEEELRGVVGAGDYSRAREVKDALGDLMARRGGMPGLPWLREASEAARVRQERAVLNDDYEEAMRLQGEIDDLGEKMRREEEALSGMTEAEAEDVQRLISELGGADSPPTTPDGPGIAGERDGSEGPPITWAVVRRRLPLIGAVALPIFVFFWWFRPRAGRAEKAETGKIDYDLLRRHVDKLPEPGRREVKLPNKLISFWRKVIVNVRL